ncbi:hypothetical protein [Nocardioides montaniterrae]
MKRWWRRNRLWLAVLPVAGGALAVAGSQRVHDYYDQQPFHHRVAQGEIGDDVKVAQSWDGPGDKTVWRRFDVRLVGVDPIGGIPQDYGNPEPLPRGAAAYAVHLAFDAQRAYDLGDCDIVLVDADGNRYGVGSDPTSQFDPCERTDDSDVPDDQLPEQWEVTANVLTAAGADIRQVWLTFRTPRPDYVVLRLR